MGRPFKRDEDDVYTIGRTKSRERAPMARVSEGRLVVLLYSIVVIPVYFILFFLYMQLDFSIFGEWAILFILFINPVTYILAWELWMLLFGTRIANTYEKMKTVVSFVSVRYNMYYGIAAVFFLFSIVFPMITPIISTLVIGSLVWRLITARHEWVDDAPTPRWMIALVVLAMIVPIGCNAYFYVAYAPVAVGTWEWFVANLIPILRDIARASGTAVTLGSLIYLFMFGTSEYELVFKKKVERPRSIFYVRVLIALLFGLFLLLIILQNPIFNIIQYSVIGLNVLIIIGNLRNRNTIAGAGKSTFSYVLIILFFLFGAINQPGFESAILIFSSIVYMMTFIIIFVRTGDD